MRNLIARSSVVAVLFAFVGAARGQSFPQGVGSGDVTETAAICWARVGTAGAVRIEIAADDQFQQVIASSVLQASEGDDLILQYDAAGLTPGTRYYYRFVHLGAGEASPVGTFKTAPQGPTAFRFVYTGDSNAEHQPFYVFDLAAAEAPDLWFWAGDTAYCDGAVGGLPPATDLAEYRAKHRQNRNDPFVQSLLAASPVWTQWDDHEVANDYDGGDLEPTITPQQRAAGYQAFFEYMPIRRQGLAHDPDRTYRSIRYGDLAEFFILDCRQYRSRDVGREGGGIDPRAFFLPTYESETIARLGDPSRTMLGRPQLEWLKQGLLHSTATWKFVLSSVPFTSLLVMPYDRWDGYDAERYDIFQLIQQNAIPGVVLLSADIHGNVYNPDVTYFLRTGLREVLSASFSIPEFIAGPVATETIRREIGELGAVLLDTPPDELTNSLFFHLGFNFLANHIKSRNHLEFLEPNRFAYLVVDVTPDRLTLTHKGILPDSSIVDPELQILNEEVLTTPAGCFPAPLFPFFFSIAATGFAKATRARRAAFARRVLQRRG